MNAILEKDVGRISAAVHAALIAIAEREHELFYATSGNDERELLQDARYALAAVLSKSAIPRGRRRVAPQQKGLSYSRRLNRSSSTRISESFRPVKAEISIGRGQRSKNANKRQPEVSKLEFSRFPVTGDSVSLRLLFAFLGDDECNRECNS